MLLPVFLTQDASSLIQDACGRVSGVPTPLHSLMYEAPPPDAYRSLRAAVGFTVWSDEVARQLIQSSLFWCHAADEGGNTVGCARVVGDGIAVFHVVDVMVRPEWQGMGVGSTLMNAVMKWLRSVAAPQAIVGLLANSGRASFYEAWGFVERPAGAPGMSRRL